MFQTLTLALSGVNTFRYKQSSETFVGQTSEGRPQGIDWGQPGGSSVVCSIPGQGKGGLCNRKYCMERVDPLHTAYE